MNDKELVRVAGRVQRALEQLRKSRYMRCAAQLSLFAGALQDLVRHSRRLAVAVSRDWFVAAERSCKSAGRQLDEIPFLASNLQSLLDRRHREVPGLSVIADELRALQQEFDEVEFNHQQKALCVTTESITLEDISLGRFQVVLHLDDLNQMYQRSPYRILALEPNPAANDSAITHPHVSNEVLCEGEGGAAIRAALEEGRLADFFSMVRSILTTYNPDSPYVPLADWDGTPCSECGYLMDRENVGYCSECGDAICDQCDRVCIDCGELLCSHCARECGICEQPLCRTCAKRRCAHCESICCQSCLEDGLCPNCKEESEDQDDDTDNAEGTPEETDQAQDAGQSQPVPVG
jgi:hypothetical protein